MDLYSQKYAVELLTESFESEGEAYKNRQVKNSYQGHVVIARLKCAFISFFLFGNLFVIAIKKCGYMTLARKQIYINFILSGCFFN